MAVVGTQQGREEGHCSSVVHSHPYVVAAASGYVGYRIGRGRAGRKSRPIGAIWFILVGLLGFVVIGYVVVQILKLLLAGMATLVYLVFRSRRSWMWMRISWGLCAMPVINLQCFGRGMSAHERNRLIVKWVYSVPLTGVYRPRHAEAR